MDARRVVHGQPPYWDFGSGFRQGSSRIEAGYRQYLEAEIGRIEADGGGIGRISAEFRQDIDGRLQQDIGRI